MNGWSLISAVNFDATRIVIWYKYLSPEAGVCGIPGCAGIYNAYVLKGTLWGELGPIVFSVIV